MYVMDVATFNLKYSKDHLRISHSKYEQWQHLSLYETWKEDTRVAHVSINSSDQEYSVNVDFKFQANYLKIFLDFIEVIKNTFPRKQIKIRLYC